MTSLHTRGDQLALSPALRAPATSIRRLSTDLLLVLLNASLKFRAEVTDKTLDRPGESLTQGTDSVTLNLLGEFLEHVDFALLGDTGFETLHHLHGPLAALTAGSALATTLVLVEGGETADGADDVGALVHDDYGGGSETGLRVFQGVEVHELVVADGFGDNGCRRSTGDNGLQVVPATADTTAVLVDQLAERDGHFLLDSARVVDVAGDTEQLGTCVSLATERREPAGTAAHDGRSHSDGFDVGDGTGATEGTDGGGEWRLQTRLAGLSFEGLDEGGLLTADISTGTTVDVDVVVVARSAGVLTDLTGLVGFVDGALEDGCFVVEFTANVNVGSVGVHRSSDDQTPLDQLLRVFPHDLSVLAGSGFTLVGVHDQVTGAGILLPVFEVHE